jgi:hypothetical protein
VNYANDTSQNNRVAFTSPGEPKQKSFTTVTMQSSYLQGVDNNTLKFGLISYSPSGNHAQDAITIDGPTVFLSKAATKHFSPPPHTKLPSNLSLLIGLPLGLGALVFVLLGLFFGMRKTRMINVGSVMGKRKGYGVGKSRRQRIGKKGAIRLEEREVLQSRDRGARTGASRMDDEIRPVGSLAAPNTTWPLPPSRDGHRREESFGSLVSDSEGGNAFRREMEKQRTGR